MATEELGKKSIQDPGEMVRSVTSEALKKMQRPEEARKGDKVFSEVRQRLFGFEGGFNNIKGDSPTNFGVKQQVLDEYRKEKGLPPLNVKEMREEEATRIFREKYFDKVQAEKLPVPIAASLVDFAINSGPSAAVKKLQEIIGATVDGGVGPETLEKVGRIRDPKEVALLLLDSREKFVREVAANRPEKRKFLAGWISRINKLRESI